MRRHGAGFLVATVPTAIQVDPDQKKRATYAARLGVENLLYPDERLRVLGQERGFPVVDLCYPFLQHSEANHDSLHGFANTSLGTGHLNSDGHRLAAEGLASKIMESLDED